MAKLNPIARTNPLTAAQVAVLSAAAQRQDGGILLPVSAKGKVASALGNGLIAKGLAREVRTKLELSAWRRDAETGKSYALIITKAGRAAAAVSMTEVEEVSAEQGVGRFTPALVGDARQQSEPEASESGSGRMIGGVSLKASNHHQSTSAPRASAPRPDSKLAGLIELLERETGATIEELTAATGWLPHTTRAALTGLRKRGFAVTTERQHGAQTNYRIQPAPALQVA